MKSAAVVSHWSLMYNSPLDNEKIGIVFAGKKFPHLRDKHGEISQKYLRIVVEVIDNLQKLGDTYYIYVGNTLQPALYFLEKQLGKTFPIAIRFIETDADLSIPENIDNVIVLSESSDEISDLLNSLGSANCQSLKWVLNGEYSAKGSLI